MKNPIDCNFVIRNVMFIYVCKLFPVDVVLRGYSGWNTRMALQVLDQVFPKVAELNRSLDKRKIQKNMKFLQSLKKSASSARNRCGISPISSNGSFFSHQLHSQPPRLASFGIAFDIDGVILRGETPIGGSSQALKRLYDDSGTLTTPYVFLTNGGGVPESERASELSKLLSVPISPLQVIQGHSPFKQLVKRYENELIIAVGKGEPVMVMSEYGFKNVLSIDEYASYFEHIDPLRKYKNWMKQRTSFEKSSSRETTWRNDPCSQSVQAVFIVSDSIDWSRDIQVLCDILSTGGLPGKAISRQPPLYFANDDLSYQGLFPTVRLGMGAFRIALESIYNRMYHNALEYTSYGKPNPSVFKNAENVMMQVVPSSTSHQINGQHPFKTLYMVGDNPAVDIKGAKEAGLPWFSILTRTGVFKGKENHPLYPADLVVDTVEEAVDYILRKETCQPDHSS